MNSKLPGWPSFTEQEADGVTKVLLSNKVNYWTGTEGREFECEFSAYSDSKYALAVANGTVALDLALYGLNIGSRYGGSSSDEVIVTPRSFIASVSAIVFAGAKPVFADVCEDSGNITPDTIAPCLTENTRAVICVHLAGWPCDIAGIREICASTLDGPASAGASSVKIIEDCAQAHGAKIGSKSVGSLGDVAAWSFCQDKIMTTGGEGGMVTCEDEDLWKRMWAFKDHGKSYDAVYNKQHPPGFRWLHESFGTNWRLTEMQSVLGRIQLERMPDWTAARTKNAAKLTATLSRFSGANGCIRLPHAEHKAFNDGDEQHAWYKFYCYVKPEQLADGWTRDKIVEAISSQGFPAFQGSCSEIYREKAFDGSGFRPAESLPSAKKLADTSLMLLVHPTLTDQDMQRYCEAIETVIEQCVNQ